jgi:hypothetical protein
LVHRPQKSGHFVGRHPVIRVAQPRYRKLGSKLNHISTHFVGHSALLMFVDLRLRQSGSAVKYQAKRHEAIRSNIAGQRERSPSSILG